MLHSNEARGHFLNPIMLTCRRLTSYVMRKSGSIKTMCEWPLPQVMILLTLLSSHAPDMNKTIRKLGVSTRLTTSLPESEYYNLIWEQTLIGYLCSTQLRNLYLGSFKGSDLCT